MTKPTNPMTQMRELEVPGGMVAICALGQAGFLLKGAGGTLIAIDPYLSDRIAGDSEFGPPGRWVRRFPPPFRPDELDADIVVITHQHADHFDPESLKHRSFPLLVPPAVTDQAALVGEAVPVSESLERSGVMVHPVPAAHSLTYTGPDCYQVQSDRFLGYVIELEPGVTVYHAGDTIPAPEIEKVLARLRPRVALLPVNGRDRIREEMGIVGNLSVAEAGHFAAAADARWMVPSHHDLFAVNSEQVARIVDVLDRQFPDQEYLVPKVGRPVVLGV